MTKRHITIATRESPLAMRQAELIRDQLLQYHPHLSIEFLGITTQGDKRLDTVLRDIGGKGLFVKELEEALWTGKADMAVHSMKDVPMDLPSGLCIAAIQKREEPRDVFVSNQYASILELPRGALLGTASLRRQTQMRALRSDLTLKNLRGNIHTRLKKLDEKEYDAIILAAAGLLRMNLSQRIRSYLSTEQSLPAAGQGALGVECRYEDTHLQALLKPLNDLNTFHCVSAERALCRKLNGGCKVPLAAYAHLSGHQLILRGMVADEDAIKILRTRVEGDREHAEALGLRAAEELLQQGAGKILEKYNG